MGDDLEINNENSGQKLFVVNKYLVQLCEIIVSDIENYQLNSAKTNLGAFFKLHALYLKQNINKLNPFTSDVYTDEYFDKIISNINGYHMDNYV